MFYNDCIRQEIILDRAENWINIKIPQIDNKTPTGVNFDAPEIIITYVYSYPIDKNRHAYYLDEIKIRGKERLTKLPYRAQHKYCPACSSNNIKVTYTKSFGENFNQEKLICRCESCTYNWHTNLDDE